MVKICVFCSSTENLHEDFITTAKKLGTLLGKNKHHLVYGGSHRGLMGELSKNFAEHSEEITEIIPKMWTDITVGNGKVILTENLRDRLDKMEELSDAFITLPGGLGSIHEMMDILVSKQLKFHNKPLVIINVNGLYDPLIEQIKTIIEQGLAPEDNHQLIHVVKTPEEALEYIKNYIPCEIKEKNL